MSKQQTQQERLDEDRLMATVHNMRDYELRQVLEHLCLIHPRAVQTALSHVRQQDDLASVATELVSNRTPRQEYIPPPAVLSRSTSGGDLKPKELHQQSAGEIDTGSPLQPPVRRQPSMLSPSSNPQPPVRRQPSLMASPNSAPPPPPIRHRPSIQGQGSVQPPSRQQQPPPEFTIDPLEEYEQDDGGGDNDVGDNDDDDATVVNMADHSGSGACYLVYDADSAKLLLVYSRQRVHNAVGVWRPTPPRTIQGFKFQQNMGRSELIGNCAAGVAGRKNYYSGWCQFIRAARAMDGILTVFPKRHQDGLEVDLYAYYHHNRPQNCYQLGENTTIVTTELDAVACLPKHTIFYRDMNVDLVKWMSEASAIGFATEFVNSSSNGSSPKKKTFVGAPQRNLSAPQAPTTTPQSAKPRKVLSGIDTSALAAAANAVTVPSGSPSSFSGGAACFLLYDSDAGKLMLQYSKTNKVPNAIGRWTPGPSKRIQNFKFTQNLGRSELIGNCASGVSGRKNYYSGWIQFIKGAMALQGDVTLLTAPPNAVGLPVDIYFYVRGQQTILLPRDRPYDVSGSILAVACLPKFAKFYQGITVDLTKWMTEASSIGAASRC